MLDTRRPMVQQALPSVAVVADSEVGTGGFYIDLIYPEAMDGSQPVLVQLTGPAAVSSTFSPNVGASSWLSSHTYRAVFHVVDQNVEWNGVGTIVSFAKDLAGNTQSPFTATALFDLDTRNPSVLLLSANTYTITSANSGSAGFELATVFDEDMDELVPPTLLFSEDLSGVLTLDASSSQWLSPSTYRASYDVANVDALFGAVGVSVSGALDRAGNPVQTAEHPSFFAIDLQAVGIQELSSQGGLTIFPNPVVSGQLIHLLLGQDLLDVELVVFNSLGAMEHRVSLGNLASGINTVALPELTTGVYLLRFSVQGQLHSQSLIIEDH